MTEITFLFLVITVIIGAIGSGIYASYVYANTIPMWIAAPIYALFLAVVLAVTLLLISQIITHWDRWDKTWKVKP